MKCPNSITAETTNSTMSSEKHITHEDEPGAQAIGAGGSLSRRNALKMSGTAVMALAGGAMPSPIAAQSTSAKSSGTKKSVIVIGAGIAGLSCAYELKRRGHDVMVLEATGRPGGHVRT